MPRGNGTGPPAGGRGRGMGRGGRMGGTRPGSGPGGECVCPECGTRSPHKIGSPCYDQNCPKCGAKMVKG